MRKNLFLIALVTVCFAIYSFAPGDWVPYESKDGKFKASFPTKPLAKTTAKDKMDIVSVKAKDAKTKIAYSVDAQIYSKKIDPKSDILQNTLDAYAKTIKGTVDEDASSTFKIDEYEGLETKMKGTKDACVNYRVVAAGKILYQITITSVKEYASEEDVTKFFDSFELVASSKKK